MQLQFNEIKATQAAARFMDLAGGSLNYMVLGKLLYLLDREALLAWGRTVTFAEYYSMKAGPVLSEVHDLITEIPMPGSYWSSHIVPGLFDYSVRLRSDPGADALSEAEIDIIEKLFKQYGHYNRDPFALVDLLHKILPEWTEVQKGRVPLQIRDILTKGGNKSVAEAEAIEGELQSLSEDYKLLAAR